MSELQSDDPLAPVSVVVRSPYVGLVARRALAEGGCANVRMLVLRQLAARVAGPAAGRTRGALTGVLEGAAMRAALHGPAGEAFASARQQRSLQTALAGLFRELRHQADQKAVLAAFAARGGLAAAAAATFRRFLELTDGYYDVPALARLAAEAAERPAARWPAEVGALVLYLPARLDPAEIAMLGRIGRRVPIRAALLDVGDEQADREPREQAAALVAALGVAEPAADGAAARWDAELVLVSAPDPAEEVRLVARRVWADLEAGVPLWRVGLLYGQAERYGALVRETLDTAGLPWHAAEGRPVAASWAARSLQGLLALRERRFARAAVLEWLVGRPPIDEPSADDLCAKVPLSAWDHLSREAQVLEGPAQWAERFTTLAARLERKERPGPGPRESAQARAIARAVARLDADTRPPADGAPWDAFVEWAAFLVERYLPSGASWPAAELAAAEAVGTALESLRDAAALEPATDLATFRGALANALETRRLPEGTPGRGVLVGPIGAAVGAAFERLYLVGLVEGALPGRPAADPLGAADGGDPLGRRERRLADDRRAFLAALAGADGGTVVASYPRSDGAARELHPSRWLLELVGRKEGRTVYASELPRLHRPERPWLPRVESARDGVARLAADPAGPLAPADLHDRRLAGVLAWTAAGHRLAEHPLARRADLPLGAALRAARARRSRTFSPYDGNLAELAGQSERMARAFGSGFSSASAVERWAACPFQYLLQDVLRVQATTRPEEEWTISPRDRGTLIHGILETFFQELHAAGRLGPDDAFAPPDHARIEAIAVERFAALEAAGQTGHPLAWENTRLAILADLHTLLEKDQAWRREERLRPAYFEQSFGRDDAAGSWPAATLTLADGRTVAFEGAIDRVDLSPPGIQPRTALIVDYKSGRTPGPAGPGDDDPLLGGRQIQLALYARALRAGLKAGPDELTVQAEFRSVTSRGGFARLTITADEVVNAELERVVRTVADGVGLGVFPAVPGPFASGSFESCRRCDYDRVCAVARDEAWERKCRQPGALLHLELGQPTGGHQ